ncbi:HAMP domain-containing protein [Halioglobus maricola]|uniref:histidine kinase n=1 Tax=Halioglobus maricola TaxID=2601894 RepID=A0A5P9NJ14_9GAMM|nr:ATP-binding protein [Halioglobus maricola]QFU75722.1 HAMP domain-containing protein [Halioglobus maricola]
MRSGIFLKIFLGFWLATIAIVGSSMLVNQYFDDQPRQEHPDSDGDRRPPPRFVLNLLYQIQHQSPEEVAEFVATLESEHNLQVYLLKRGEGEILGKAVPPAVAEVADRLSHRRGRAYLRQGDKRYFAHRVRDSQQGNLRVVLEFQADRRGFINALIEHLWLRILLALLVSGLVCYGLSRFMTRRLAQLQQAANRIAGGDLEARLDVRDKGGDETDQLARDFNSMAGQLQARMEAQRQLLSDISHELRSPLARLRVALALAQDAPDQGARYLERMERETERLEELIQQLLSAHQEQRELDSHIDLVGLLKNLCQDASFEGKAEGTTARLDTGLEQAVVASTGDLLHRCFENILRNGLRHTAPGSVVTAGILRIDHQYRIEIEDRGPGLPETELNRIFDEFYRVDTARSREDGGHGLGLSIARRAIELHGGTIRAENTGSGLRVTVSLPMSN